MFVSKGRKQIWFLVALMSLMLLLVACSSDEESSSNTEEDSGTEQSTTPSDNTATENTGDSLSGTLEIQYFVGGYGDEWWKRVIGDFQKQHPDLEIVEHAGPNINTEMNTRWISNTPPDVVYIDGAGASETQMIAEGQLMDISEFAKSIKLENGTALLDSFISPAEEVDGGKMYSLPLVFDTWGTWYDSKWFEENGWEVPTDFDSWLSSMEKIKGDANIAPLVTTGQHTQYFQRGVLNPAFAAAGGEELLNGYTSGVGNLNDIDICEISDKQYMAIVSAMLASLPIIGDIDEEIEKLPRVKGGRNLLFYGVPGSGKSYAISKIGVY